MSAGPKQKISTGDTVVLLADGRQVEAHVVLASDNSCSLMVAFDAILFGFVGMMPLLWQDDGFETLLGDGVVVSKPAKETHASE